MLQNKHCSHPTIYFTILATNLRLSPIVKDSEQCWGSLIDRGGGQVGGLKDRHFQGEHTATLCGDKVLLGGIEENIPRHLDSGDRFSDRQSEWRRPDVLTSGRYFKETLASD